MVTSSGTFSVSAVESGMVTLKVYRVFRRITTYSRRLCLLVKSSTLDSTTILYRSYKDCL